MTIKIFLCDFAEYTDGGMTGWGSYIRVYYAMPHIQMRINGKNALVAIDASDVTPELEADPNVEEIAWESDSLTSNALKIKISDKLGISSEKMNNMTYKTLFEKLLTRNWKTGKAKFDVKLMEQYFQEGKVSRHIDLVNSEMDL